MSTKRHEFPPCVEADYIRKNIDEAIRLAPRRKHGDKEIRALKRRLANHRKNCETCKARLVV